MAPFRFRLNAILEWYRKQYQLEQGRLGTCAERAVQAETELERHRKDVLALQLELIQAPAVQALELVALGSFRHRAKQREVLLRQNWLKSRQAFDHQRTVVQAAQRRLRLIERLRDKRLSEYDYELSRELEALASESHLAAFARGLNDPPNP